MVNIELKLGRIWKLCCDSAKLDDIRSFCILSFWNGLVYHILIPVG